MTPFIVLPCTVTTCTIILVYDLSLRILYSSEKLGLFLRYVKYNVQSAEHNVMLTLFLLR